MEKELYRFNPWWEDDFQSLELLKNREDTFALLLQNIENKQIVLLTGLRRIGKTSLMKLCIRHLIENNIVEANKILYLSLDDYLLSDHSIIELVEEFRKIHKIKSNQKVYLFLDEITFADDYEKQLKNLYDAGHAKIFASASSASLLKKQKGLLTGRSITFEILPLSFDAYLSFKNISIKKADAHLKEQYFREFLKTGGIPEFVLTGDDAYIRELMDNIIYKDIASMHGIRQISQLKDYFLMLMERSGKTMSINKVAKVLGMSTQTSKHYFDLFCDTFIVYPVVRHGKLNEQMVSPKKIYACDNGIRTYYTGERDWGALFENYVFLRLKHFNLRYVYQDSIEIDFFSENKYLIECKFHDEELSEKQQKLFDYINANQKFIIRNEADIESVRLMGNR